MGYKPSYFEECYSRGTTKSRIVAVAKSMVFDTISYRFFIFSALEKTGVSSCVLVKQVESHPSKKAYV